MAQDPINTWATFRYALGYPDETHLAAFRAMFSGVPDSIGELRSLYIELFDAGFPQPQCPLNESFYVSNRPAGEVVLENKLFYQHFGLQSVSHCAPDHLLTQMEFLSWLDYCIESGNPDRASLERARREYIERHVAHWAPVAAGTLDRAGAGCYAELFALLAESVGS
jgi:nitrate reductase assembly molybdenum cofactor insertion protein NarJ